MQQRLHDRFDHWLDRVEEQVKVPTPILEELTQAVFTPRYEWTPEVTEGLVVRVHLAVIEQRTPPHHQCGRTSSPPSPHDRTVEMLVGAIRPRRSGFYCKRCERCSAPLNAALELMEHRKQPDMHKDTGK